MSSRGARGFARLPEVALLVALIVAIGEISGAGGRLADALGPLLPIDPSSVDPLDAISATFALAALVIGVRRGKRLVWPLAIAIFASAAAGQALLLRHPLGAALAVGCLVVLLLDARRYRTSTDRPMRRLAGAVVGAAAFALVVGSVAADVVAAAPSGSFLDDLAVRTVETLDFVDPTGVISADRPEEVFEAVEFIARTSVLVALLAILAADPDRPRAAQLARRRAVARRYAHGPLAPFQTGRDKWLYADRRGVGIVAYGRAGRTAVVLGDPIGSPSAAWRAFRSFVARCSAGDVTVAVYQASEDALDELRRSGFRVFRVGEEATLDLRTFDLTGSARANLRHTVTRARRGGIATSWHPAGLPTDELSQIGPQLIALDREWCLAHGPGLGFSIAPFVAADLRATGVSLGVDADGRVAAFATFRRTAPDAWVLDVMRRSRDAVPGALEACIADAVSDMRRAGDVTLSLGLVALARLSVSGGAPEERLLAAGRRVAGRWYDVRGLLFFKQKFAPDWVPRFGAVQGRMGIFGFSVALLRLHLNLGAATTPARIGGRARGVRGRSLASGPAGGVTLPP